MACRGVLDLPLIIQTIRMARFGSDAIDDPPNMSRADPSGADRVDAEHQACPPRKGKYRGPSRRHLAVAVPTTGMCLSVWGPGGGQTQGVRTMYGSASLYPKPFALLRAGVPESAPNLPQSEHPTTSNAAGQRPSHPFAGSPRQGPSRRLSCRPGVTGAVGQPQCRIVGAIRTRTTRTTRSVSLRKCRSPPATSPPRPLNDLA
jgi:hypothetical protein